MDHDSITTQEWEEWLHAQNPAVREFVDVLTKGELWTEQHYLFFKDKGEMLEEVSGFSYPLFKEKVTLEWLTQCFNYLCSDLGKKMSCAEKEQICTITGKCYQSISYKEYVSFLEDNQKRGIPVSARSLQLFLERKAAGKTKTMKSEGREPVAAKTKESKTTDVNIPELPAGENGKRQEQLEEEKRKETQRRKETELIADQLLIQIQSSLKGLMKEVMLELHADQSAGQPEKTVEEMTSGEYAIDMGGQGWGHVSLGEKQNSQLRRNKGVLSKLSNVVLEKRYQKADIKKRKRIILHHVLNRKFDTACIRAISKLLSGVEDNLDLVFQLAVDASTDEELLNGVSVFFDMRSLHDTMSRSEEKDSPVLHDIMSQSEEKDSLALHDMMSQSEDQSSEEENAYEDILAEQEDEFFI